MDVIVVSSGQENIQLKENTDTDKGITLSVASPRESAKKPTEAVIDPKIDSIDTFNKGSQSPAENQIDSGFELTDSKDSNSPVLDDKKYSSKGRPTTVANSIEQLLNDQSESEKVQMNKKESDDTKIIQDGENVKDRNLSSNTTLAKELGSEIVKTSSGTDKTAEQSKGAFAMESKTAPNDNAEIMIKIKQEPVDVVEDVAGILPNAILTEAQPSDVQDIRNMLPPLPIPSRGPGIRHRYTMIKTAPPPDTYVCEVCQSELPTQKHLQTHKLCHFNSSHVCYACDTYFVHSDTLVMHMATIHRDLNPGGQAAIEDGLVCSVCLQRFSSQTNLAKHHNIHMIKDGKSSACRVCGVDFSGARALMSHLGSPGHIAMKVKMQSVFVCVDCRSIFSSRDSYAMHMMMRAQDEVCKGPAAGGDMPALPGAPLQIQQVENMAAVITQPSLPASTIAISSSIPQVQHSHYTTTNTIISGGNMTVQEACRTSSPGGLQQLASAGSTSGQSEATDVINRSSPLNLSTNNSSVAGSPHSDSRSASAVINACSLCPTQFQSQDALALHMMYHARGEGVINQTQQENMFNRPNSVPLASMTKAGPSPWMCGKCLYSFDTCDTLAMHMMTKHANEHDAAGNLAALQAAATANQQRSVMASAAEIAQTMVQKIVQQQQQQQKQQPVFPVQSHLPTKRHSVHSDPEDIGHEIKKRKSSQPIKKQWNCENCEQMYPTKIEFDQHQQFCKLPAEGAAPKCQLCDITFTDMRVLGLHLRSPIHLHTLRSSTMTVRTKMGYTNQGDEDADKSVGYYSSRSNSSSLSAYSDQGPVSISPAFSEGQETKINNPLNLVTEDENQSYNTRDQRRRTPHSSSSAQSPESSSISQQNYSTKDHWKNGSDHGTPVLGSGHVTQSGISPSEEENDADEDDESEQGEVMEFVLAHGSDLIMCKYCKIIYTDKTLYHLHMGLHNLNNQWQCNMCGKQCRNLHEFTSHVIHYKI